MPFQPGNTLAKRRQTYSGGRPTREEAEREQTAADIVKEIVSASAKPLAQHFVKRSKVSDSVLVHAINKLWPDELDDTPRGPTFNVIIAGQIIQQPGFEPDIRANGLQIRFGSDNGQNGNGSNGA